jgi:hypothetical protein
LQRQSRAFEDRKKFFLSARTAITKDPDNAHLIVREKSLSPYREMQELMNSSHEAVEKTLQDYHGPQAK